MTEAQIKHMVSRFLAWKLPENFNPDDGISFEPIAGKDGPHPFRRTPQGTNLFGADQAEAMVRHMLEGLPDADEANPVKKLAIVYDEPPSQVFVNAAAAFGVTAEVAKAMFGQMVADSQPTIVNGVEPHTLALNKRAIETMCAVEGGAAVNTRWMGVRYPQKEQPPRGGFLSAKVG